MPSNPADFVQADGNTVVDSALTARAIDILGGRLGGHGVVTGAVTIGSGGVLGPGNSPGTLNIDGTLTVTGNPKASDGGVLEIEIAGRADGQYDVLRVNEIAGDPASGKVTFAPGSRIHFVLYDTYHPADAAPFDDFTFLFASQLVGVANLAYSITGLASNFHYQVYEDKHSDLHVRFYVDGSSPGYAHNVLYDGQVPVPSTLALGALGVALIGWRSRRRSFSR